MASKAGPLLITIYLVMGVMYTVEAIECKEGWTSTYDVDVCYKLGTLHGNYYGAESHCESLGNGHTLARIYSFEEQEAANLAIKNQQEFVWAWGSDAVYEGTWEWGQYTGDIMSYTVWHEGEPSDYGGNQDCLILVRDWDYFWDDVDCADDRPYPLCEYRPRR